jgi:hypothetical protein
METEVCVSVSVEPNTDAVVTYDVDESDAMVFVKVDVVIVVS